MPLNQEMDAIREASIVRRRRQSPEQGPLRSVASLRNDVLHAMAPLDDGITYNQGAMSLLNEFEEALRRAWERADRSAVLTRAVDAMQATIRSLDAGGLL